MKSRKDEMKNQKGETDEMKDQKGEKDVKWRGRRPM